MKVAFLYMVLNASAFAASNEWLQDQKGYNAALVQMKAQNKPVLVYFYADWCGACKTTKENVFANAGVARTMENFVLVQINVDLHENDALVYKYMSMVYGNSGSYGIPQIFLKEASGEHRDFHVPPQKRAEPMRFNDYLNDFLNNKINYAVTANQSVKPPGAKPVSHSMYGYILLQVTGQPYNENLQKGLVDKSSNSPKEAWSFELAAMIFKRYGWGFEIDMGFSLFQPSYLSFLGDSRDYLIGWYLDFGPSFNLLDLDGFQITGVTGLSTGAMTVAALDQFPLVHPNVYIKINAILMRKLNLFTAARFFTGPSVLDVNHPYWSFGVGFAM